MQKKYLVLLFFVLALFGCQQTANEQDVDDLQSVEKPSVVQLSDGDDFVLTAEAVAMDFNGEKQEMLAYNGSIPGPTIIVKQGSVLNLKFVNNLDSDSSLHSHGLRLANEFDGVPGLTQDEVQPGGEFDYELMFPDAGVYFYHPHTRADYQQDAGLYGAFLVLPTDTEVNEFGVNLDADHEIVYLDDIELSPQGLPIFSKNIVQKTLMGRFGTDMLINGQLNSVLDWENMTKEDHKLVTFINTANVRPFNLQVEGAVMSLVADDASGFLKLEQVDTLLIGPSERYTVMFEFLEGQKFELYSQGETSQPKYVIAQGDVGMDLVDVEILYDGLEIDDQLLADLYDMPVEKNLVLDMYMQDMSGGHVMHGMMSMPCHQMPDGSWMGDCEEDTSFAEGHNNKLVKIEFEDEMKMMNQMSNLANVDWIIRDASTGLEGMDIDWKFNAGEYVKIKIKNDSDSMHPMQHPFHIHGQRFLVSAINGEDNLNLAWQDTVLIPSGDTYEIVVEMANIGIWMSHCHIPEHMEAGMMMKFEVI